MARVVAMEFDISPVVRLLQADLSISLFNVTVAQLLGIEGLV